MTTAQLKQKLISKIDNIADNNLLEDIYRILEAEESETEILILNDEQKKAIKEAKSQIKDGKFFTDEEAEKDIGEWLKE